MIGTLLPLRSELRRCPPQRLMLKEIFLQLLLLRLVCKTYRETTFKLKFKYKARHLFMTTRAPYRYKLTRNQYLIERHYYAIYFSLTSYQALTITQLLNNVDKLTK